MGRFKKSKSAHDYFGSNRAPKETKNDKATAGGGNRFLSWLSSLAAGQPRASPTDDEPATRAHSSLQADEPAKRSHSSFLSAWRSTRHSHPPDVLTCDQSLRTNDSGQTDVVDPRWESNATDIVGAVRREYQRTTDQALGHGHGQGQEQGQVQGRQEQGRQEQGQQGQGQGQRRQGQQGQAREPELGGGGDGGHREALQRALHRAQLQQLQDQAGSEQGAQRLDYQPSRPTPPRPPPGQPMQGQQNRWQALAQGQRPQQQQQQSALAYRMEYEAAPRQAPSPVRPQEPQQQQLRLPPSNPFTVMAPAPLPNRAHEPAGVPPAPAANRWQAGYGYGAAAPGPQHAASGVPAVWRTCVETSQLEECASRERGRAPQQLPSPSGPADGNRGSGSGGGGGPDSNRPPGVRWSVPSPPATASPSAAALGRRDRSMRFSAASGLSASGASTSGLSASSAVTASALSLGMGPASRRSSTSGTDSGSPAPSRRALALQREPSSTASPLGRQWQGRHRHDDEEDEGDREGLDGEDEGPSAWRRAPSARSTAYGTAGGTAQYDDDWDAMERALATCEPPLPERPSARDGGAADATEGPAPGGRGAWAPAANTPPRWRDLVIAAAKDKLAAASPSHVGAASAATAVVAVSEDDRVEFGPESGAGRGSRPPAARGAGGGGERTSASEPERGGGAGPSYPLLSAFRRQSVDVAACPATPPHSGGRAQPRAVAGQPQREEGGPLSAPLGARLTFGGVQGAAAGGGASASPGGTPTRRLAAALRSPLAPGLAPSSPMRFSDCGSRPASPAGSRSATLIKYGSQRALQVERPREPSGGGSAPPPHPPPYPPPYPPPSCVPTPPPPLPTLQHSRRRLISESSALDSGRPPRCNSPLGVPLPRIRTGVAPAGGGGPRSGSSVSGAAGAEAPPGAYRGGSLSEY